jgi:hypothetical protein
MAYYFILFCLSAISFLHWKSFYRYEQLSNLHFRILFIFFLSIYTMGHSHGLAFKQHAASSFFGSQSGKSLYF